MGLKIPRTLVEFILLGPEDDRRQLQDSPILGDVWVEFARRPGERLELLITPYKEEVASITAQHLHKALTHGPGEAANIAYLQGIVAARLRLDEVIQHVVPITYWWSEGRIAESLQQYLHDRQQLTAVLEATRQQAEQWLAETVVPDSKLELESQHRFSSLAAILTWAARQTDPPDLSGMPMKQQSARILTLIKGQEGAIVDELIKLFPSVPSIRDKAMVWTVSLNRRATTALTRSVPAVKADAARTLFTVNCSEIVWAVIDGGIDARHYAFTAPKRSSKSELVCRIRKTYDFTTIRDIVTLDNLDDERRAERVKAMLQRPLQAKLAEKAVDAVLLELARGAEQGRAINWHLVEQLVELNPAAASPPPTKHGTHVAGIIGASTEGAQEKAKAEEVKAEEARKQGDTNAGKPVKVEGSDWADGMCPDINIWDFRVLAPSLKETEFAVIAALQFVRYVNERYSFMTIHGANLSLSIPHDVRNFACGRTPVCLECERLVNSGVVVVAAAGNRGYQNFETAEGQYEGYAAFSVTDPGNADGVITVGATHRYWPHTYGVSFFSSRGPTGDGRLKPDLVAPGEKIRGPLPGNTWGDLDGTSMAAPHVSGAAAMLMARYSELVGQPRRIKTILAESATDLGREKSFQGRGMLDVLRAFQSI